MDDAAGAARAGESQGRFAAIFAWTALLVLGLVVASGIVGGRWSAVRPTAALFWLVACAVSNLLPIPVTSSVQWTMSAPVNMAIAFLFPPTVTAAVVATGSLTEWELRRETRPIRGAFNRAQLGLSAAGASALAGPPQNSPAWGRILVAILLYHLLNVALVAIFHGLEGRPLPELLDRALSPLPTFVAAYVAVGLLGVTLAYTYQKVGWWAAAPLLIPLLAARYGFRHIKQLERAERELRALSDKLIDERERERARIASDMHDVVLQDLAGVQLEADNIMSYLDVGAGARARQLAESVKTRVAQAIGGLREAIADLRRSGLQEGDLPTTIERFARSFHAETSIDVGVDVDRAAVSEVPLPVALLIYECCQEALTNVARHSGASHVELRLVRQGDALELRVTDDGRGPRVSAHGPPRLGLELTRDKVALVGGLARLGSGPTCGAELIVRIPIRRVEDGGEQSAAAGDNHGAPGRLPAGRRRPKRAPLRETTARTPSDPSLRPPTERATTAQERPHRVR